MTALEDRHAVATARELTYAAGVPLRDRYGFAAPDDDVLANAIGAANMVGTVELADGYDTPIDEAYERRVVAAVRPVVAAADRRAAR